MKSFLSYVGGKSKLSSTIIRQIPPHKTYCEVFSGAAWVFFAKDASKCEILNDFDGDLIDCYRVIQNHLEEFLKQFKWLLSSRKLFEEWKQQQEAGGLTDIQRAARYYYLQRQAFGGNVRNRTFGASAARRPRVNLLRLEEELSEVHLRLAETVIENLPWEVCLGKYDKPETFFYLDPPYFKFPYYKHNLQFKDYQVMAQRLSKLQGKFLLSINDCPEMRETFSDFSISPVTVGYSMARDKKKNKQGRELLIRNH